ADGEGRQRGGDVLGLVLAAPRDQDRRVRGLVAQGADEPAGGPVLLDVERAYQGACGDVQVVGVSLGPHLAFGSRFLRSAASRSAVAPVTTMNRQTPGATQAA